MRMRSANGRGWRWGLLAAAGVGALALATPSALGARPSGRAGCSPTRTAIAYDTAGHALTHQPQGAPVPCLVFTGYATQETHLAVTRNGTVVHEPAVVTPGLLGTAFVPAPPPRGQARTSGGYPNVTYWCGNRDVGIFEPLIFERECYRSLDGGTTWEMRGILFTNPVPQHAECGADREDINSLDGNYPQG